MKDVSVIIPTYNRRAELPRALSYFNDEFYVKNEVLIIDDYSTDDTEKFIKDNYPSVRYIRQPENKGAASARNTGIEEARGRYIAFLDSDDEWLRDKIFMQAGLLEGSAADVGACFTSYYLARGNAKEKETLIRFQNRNDWFEYFLNGCLISPGTTLMVKREVFNDVGLYDKSLRRLEVWDLL